MLLLWKGHGEYQNKQILPIDMKWMEFLSSCLLCCFKTMCFLSHLSTSSFKLLPYDHIIPERFHCVGCFPFGGHVLGEHCGAVSTFPQWRGELIFSCGEQIGGWQSSTAIRAMEEAKCACGWRSTQMTMPRGQQFPSAGASARWSLACWVWLIWHISDDRWTTPLKMFVPSVILYFFASSANVKAGCILSHFSRAELQRPHHTSITSAAVQVGLQALMDVHKVTRSKHHIHNLVHHCAMELFRSETKWCEQQWE